MKSVLNSIVAFLFTCASALTLAAVGEGGELAPEPTVSVGWVYFFLVVFVAICVWFGVAIFKADRKSRTETEAAGGNK